VILQIEWVALIFPAGLRKKAAGAPEGMFTERRGTTAMNGTRTNIHMLQSGVI